MAKSGRRMLKWSSRRNLGKMKERVTRILQGRVSPAEATANAQVLESGLVACLGNIKASSRWLLRGRGPGRRRSERLRAGGGGDKVGLCRPW